MDVRIQAGKIQNKPSMVSRYTTNSMPIHSRRFSVRVNWHQNSLNVHTRIFVGTARATGVGAYPDFQDVKDEAMERHGIYLDLQTLGPLYRVRCHVGDASGIVLGESDGFVVSMAQFMHCDTMRIYNSKIKKIRRSMDLHLGFMGLGRVLAKAVLAYGLSKGCLRAEILAINDDTEIHKKLVTYYKRLGFGIVREVTGDSLSDVPHLLVWGGVGTRMDASIPEVLESFKDPGRRNKP